MDRERPVFSTVEVSICNICGQDVTGNTSADAKAHMKAGEGSGHHSEVCREITGYNIVSHAEEGHWGIRINSPISKRCILFTKYHFFNDRSQS